MENKIGKWFRSLQARSGIALLVTAAVLIEVMGLVQYIFARNGIKEEVDRRAQTELRMRNMEVKQMTSSVEEAVNNVVWVLEHVIADTNAIYDLERIFLEHNSVIQGCAVAFEADRFPSQGRWCETYMKRGEESLERRQIGSAQHDYLKAEWYTKGLKAEGGHWTDPYYDEAGAQTLVCSYTKPVHDDQGRVVGVFCSDVALDWMIDAFARQDTSNSISLLVDRKGNILACPDKTLVMQTTIQQASEGIDDSMVDHVNRAMLAGDSGSTVVRSNEGEKHYVYYAPVGDSTGWSMAIFFPDSEIFRGLRGVAFNLGILMLLGLGLMVYIMWRTVRGFRSLQTVSAEKERIGSELAIASGIQRGMLPHTFPPYPDCDEIAIYGSLIPAKEVGGDLYDFYIRDQKLFFCIGDVSGKGVPASLVMAVTRSLFRTVSTHIPEPDCIMTQMNNAMSEMNESSMFVTLFVGMLDLRTGTLAYCNAGHCAPVVVGQGLLPMDANIPVGVMPSWTFSGQQTHIDPGQTLFLYTDGLTEAENATHDQFGEQRMMEALTDSTLTPHALVDNINDKVHTFVDGADQSDDLTILAIQFTKYMEDKDTYRHLKLENDIQQVPQLAEFIESIAEAQGIDLSTTMSINLAMEEAVVNVMNYAYPKGTKGDIDITARIADGEIIFTINDSGIPFDPTKHQDPNTTLSAEERPIGGLGIHLVRQIMDHVEYSYHDNKNRLTLRKKIV